LQIETLTAYLTSVKETSALNTASKDYSCQVCEVTEVIPRNPNGF